MKKGHNHNESRNFLWGGDDCACLDCQIDLAAGGGRAGTVEAEPTDMMICCLLSRFAKEEKGFSPH